MTKEEIEVRLAELDSKIARATWWGARGSLRAISVATGLSLSTIRTILKRKGQDDQHRKREFDKQRARAFRARLRRAAAAPEQMTHEHQQAEELIKRAKEL
jgi:hypothetical protein